MSLNDPQWGRKGGGGSGGGGGKEGPPDLDELWRNFNERLAGLFGRKGPRSGGTGAEPPSGRQIGGGALALAGLVILVWLASGLYIVDESQRGVVLTFGKYSKTTSPGLQWRMPYPLQSHELVNISQVRTLEVGYRNNVKTRVLRESLMLTDDENIVDVQFAVQYTVKSPEDYLFRARRPDEIVLQVAESAFREAVGRSSMDYVLYEGRGDIAASAQKLMQDILDRYQTGIAVSTVVMQNAQPPEQVQAAFDDAVKAKQDQERLKNEGQAYFNDVVPKARGAASRLQEEANAYRQRVVANAEGEASRFSAVLAEYSRAPQVTRERMYIDAMQQIMTSTSKILVDSKQSGNMLFLPLDRILQMTAAGESAPVSRPIQIEPPPQPEPQLRSRDALRNRDRDSR